jgi:hypothetical protein
LSIIHHILGKKPTEHLESKSLPSFCSCCAQSTILNFINQVDSHQVSQRPSHNALFKKYKKTQKNPRTFFSFSFGNDTQVQLLTGFGITVKSHQQHQYI